MDQDAPPMRREGTFRSTGRNSRANSVAFRTNTRGEASPRICVPQSERSPRAGSASAGGDEVRSLCSRGSRFSGKSRVSLKSVRSLSSRVSRQSHMTSSDLNRRLDDLRNKIDLNRKSGASFERRGSLGSQIRPMSAPPHSSPKLPRPEIASRDDKEPPSPLASGSEADVKRPPKMPGMGRPSATDTASQCRSRVSQVSHADSARNSSRGDAKSTISRLSNGSKRGIDSGVTISSRLSNYKRKNSTGTSGSRPRYSASPYRSETAKKIQHLRDEDTDGGANQVAKFCTNCGGSLPPNAKFCPGCGQAAEKPVAAPAPAPDAAKHQGQFRPLHPGTRDKNSGCWGAPPAPVRAENTSPMEKVGSMGRFFSAGVTAIDRIAGTLGLHYAEGEQQSNSDPGERVAQGAAEVGKWEYVVIHPNGASLYTNPRQSNAVRVTCLKVGSIMVVVERCVLGDVSWMRLPDANWTREKIGSARVISEIRYEAVDDEYRIGSMAMNLSLEQPVVLRRSPGISDGDCRLHAGEKVRVDNQASLLMPLNKDSSQETWSVWRFVTLKGGNGESGWIPATQGAEPTVLSCISRELKSTWALVIADQIPTYETPGFSCKSSNQLRVRDLVELTDSLSAAQNTFYKVFESNVWIAEQSPNGSRAVLVGNRKPHENIYIVTNPAGTSTRERPASSSILCEGLGVKRRCATSECLSFVDGSVWVYVVAPVAGWAMVENKSGNVDFEFELAIADAPRDLLSDLNRK